MKGDVVQYVQALFRNAQAFVPLQARCRVAASLLQSCCKPVAESLQASVQRYCNKCAATLQCLCKFLKPVILLFHR